MTEENGLYTAAVPENGSFVFAVTDQLGQTVKQEFRISNIDSAAPVYLKYTENGDAIVLQFADGSWALVEVKLGGEDDIRKAADNLIRIADDIDRERTGKPAFLMVVTKNKVAYQMENGVYVVPLCCLKD